MDSQTHKRGGRPSKYRPEFPAALTAFFEDFLKEPFRREIISESVKFHKAGFDKQGKPEGGNEKERNYDYKLVPKPVPTLFAFSRMIKVDYDTVNNWSKEKIGPKPPKGEADHRPHKYQEFFGAYKRAQDFQREFFLSVGMGGLAPAAFAIFAAKNMIGWRDKNEVGFTDPQGKESTPGYILLPTRLTDAQAAAEYTSQQEVAGVTPS